MREAAYKQRAEIERRQFQRLIAVHRASGNTFRETKASVKKAEETRQKIAQGKEVRLIHPLCTLRVMVCAHTRLAAVDCASCC